MWNTGICDQYGYSYILLKKTKDAKKTAQQIIDVLRRRKVYIITNVDEDLKLIQQKYLELLRISIQGKQDD